MKKIISIVLCAVTVILISSCGNEGKEKTELNAENTSGAASVTQAAESERSGTGVSLGAVYGERTGTEKSYTGLEPLPTRSLTPVDPENSRGLSTAEFSHSYGVSKNGEPHEISVENQKKYEQYGGLCLDTSGKKVIYLTFDCGYENGVTEKILDVLKEKNVKAAFFVTMPYLEGSPEVAARMINEGHTVGNHSNTHPNFSKITRTQMVFEIESVDNYLREHFGYSSPFFRFPEGACSDSALELVQSLGYKSVFWSSAYADWDVNNPKGKEYAFNTVTSRLHPGCVLLLHAVSEDNAAALPDIIDWAQGEGYTFLPL